MKKTVARGAMALAGTAVAAASWCLLLRPRTNQPGWEKLQGVRYAHRGLHDGAAGIPENSLAAFRRAVEGGFGAELDVHLMADGNLAVVHDSDLTRVCGRRALVEDLTARELTDYPLQGTAETIPLLEEVLSLFAGRAPLIVELKVAEGNADALVDAAMARLEGYQGAFCVESFHPAALLALKKRYPWVLRGQLSENFFRAGEAGKLSWPSSAVMTWLLSTALTQPDFIAYRHEDRRCPSLRLMKKLYGVHEVAWTVRSRAAMEALEREGATVIFEGFVP
mgnify:CR=1 FL=1